MPAGSLLTLLDDIASVLDDVTLMTQLAAKKTAGVLGDDLALNAQQVAGIAAERELPVVWAVARGSIRNKLILVPSALLLSAVAPWLVAPLLMLGGAYLCYEGCEKLVHRWLHGADEARVEHAERVQALADDHVDMVAFEREKIAGAVRTDFVLSAEIIVIALGIVAQAPMLQRVSVLAAIAVIMTVGVYGLVAAIVKLDDAGFYLLRQPARAARLLGRGLLLAAPVLMKLLAVAGTVAMFMVGGGILAHGVPPLHELAPALVAAAADVAVIGRPLAALVPPLINALTGILAGALAVAVVMGGQRLTGWVKRA